MFNNRVAKCEKCKFHFTQKLTSTVTQYYQPDNGISEKAKVIHTTRRCYNSAQPNGQALERYVELCPQPVGFCTLEDPYKTNRIVSSRGYTNTIRACEGYSVMRNIGYEIKATFYVDEANTWRFRLGYDARIMSMRLDES